MRQEERPSLDVQIMDLVFGRRLTAEEAAARNASQTGRWMSRLSTALYLVWLCCALSWGAGRLGWLPIPKAQFTSNLLMLINLFALSASWLTYLSDGRFAKKPGSVSRANPPE